MSDGLAILAKRARQKKADKQRKPELPKQEKLALLTMRREARANGVRLTDNGEGGLPPSLVLGVFRRDGWTCKIHGDKGEGEYGGLQVHHKAHIEAPTSLWLLKKGRSNDPNNIVTLCKQAHDDIHDKDRALARQVDAQVGEDGSAEERVDVASSIVNHEERP